MRLERCLRVLSYDLNDACLEFGVVLVNVCEKQPFWTSSVYATKAGRPTVKKYSEARSVFNRARIEASKSSRICLYYHSRTKPTYVSTVLYAVFFC